MPSLLDRAQSLLEERLNVAVMPAEEAGSLRESADRLVQFREEAEDLAWHSLDYFSGRPQEWKPERRKRLAQRCRIALQGDPLAGAEAEHYANFSLGKGISVPQAKEEKVQRVISRAWGDYHNVENLTGYDAQRALSNELKAGSNVFILAFVRGGRVRVSYLDADTVQDVVTHPDDRRRVLWYQCIRPPKQRWKWSQDGFDLDQNLTEAGVPKPVYYAHWRNLEQARKEAIEDGIPEDRWPEELKDPPSDKLGTGVVYHVRTNRLIEQNFGVPVWARTLRFFSAMNRFVESRVAMSQASASFIARRVMKGGPKGILDSAQSILRQTGEIGSRYHREEGRQSTDDTSAAFRAPRPGSFFQENESSRLESLSLNSGAGNAVMDAQIIRGAAIAPSVFGQHLYGASESTDLATASALELPAMMGIRAWQETLEQIFRWFTNLSIEAAWQAGELGGVFYDPPEDRQNLRLAAHSYTELSIFEAEERDEIELRTQITLSYSFQMPYPGRRDLPDVTNTFTQVTDALTKLENEPMAKILLDFLLRQGIEVENPAELVDAIWDAQEKILEEKKRQAEEMAKAGLAAAKASAGTRPTARDQRSSSAPGIKGARTRTAAADPKRAKALSAEEYEQLEFAEEDLEEQVWLPEDLRGPVRDLSYEAAQLIQQAVTEPAVLASITMNGHGPQRPPEESPVADND